LRVKLVGSSTTTVLQERGTANADAAAWDYFEADISAYAGQTVYLLVEVADAGSGSLIEAALDDVLIK
jgi:aminopeptidase S